MKIGHPADKPLPAPAAGTPAAPAEPPRRRPPASAPRGAANGRRQRDGRAVEHRVDAALRRRRGEFDADKVARISQASPTASFKVNPEAIADKLIANAQELLTKVKG